MLIFILTEVQYLRKADFSFKKGLNCQNHSSSGSLHLVKKSLPSEISSGVGGIYPPLPPPLTAIWKTVMTTENFQMMLLRIL